MTSKNELYKAQYSDGFPRGINDYEELSKHPMEGQAVWYVTEYGQVWRGTFIERCYFAIEEYRVSDAGSIFDHKDMVFTIPASRVFTTPEAAYGVAIAEAETLLRQLKEQIDEIRLEPEIMA